VRFVWQESVRWHAVHAASPSVRGSHATRSADRKHTEQIKGLISRQLGLPIAVGKSVRSHPLFHRLLPLDNHSPSWFRVLDSNTQQQLVINQKSTNHNNKVKEEALTKTDKHY
jgi:hypothetical protein